MVIFFLRTSVSRKSLVLVALSSTGLIQGFNGSLKVPRIEAKVSSAWDNRGDIVIGNDVWIGYEAVILSGVHIGDGAIIGARAVVTRDVEPYTIMGGVPARPIRKRYDEETIQRLLALRWWDFPPEQMRKCLDALGQGDLQALEQMAGV